MLLNVIVFDNKLDIKETSVTSLPINPHCLRTSKTGWLEDRSHPTVARLGKRIGMVTGLATDTDADDAELLQVGRAEIEHSNYRIYSTGGQLHERGALQPAP